MTLTNWLRQTVREEVGAVAAGAVMLYPGVGLTNDVNILFTGQDIYGNQATTLDYIISGFGLASAGMASGVISVSKPVMRWAGKINNGINYYTVPSTTLRQYNK